MKRVFSRELDMVNMIDCVLVNEYVRGLILFSTLCNVAFADYIAIATKLSEKEI